MSIEDQNAIRKFLLNESPALYALAYTAHNANKQVKDHEDLQWYKTRLIAFAIFGLVASSTVGIGWFFHPAFFTYFVPPVVVFLLPTSAIIFVVLVIEKLASKKIMRTEDAKNWANGLNSLVYGDGAMAMAYLRKLLKPEFQTDFRSITYINHPAVGFFKPHVLKVNLYKPILGARKGVDYPENLALKTFAVAAIYNAFQKIQNVISDEELSRIKKDLFLAQVCVTNVDKNCEDEELKKVVQIAVTLFTPISQGTINFAKSLPLHSSLSVETGRLLFVMDIMCRFVEELEFTETGEVDRKNLPQDHRMAHFFKPLNWKFALDDEALSGDNAKAIVEELNQAKTMKELHDTLKELDPRFGEIQKRFLQFNHSMATYT